MKLINAHLTNFRSIRDSGEFDLGELTCLVGKNEAGKTAVLQALRGVNPHDDYEYDATRDYPRGARPSFKDLNDDYSQVCETTWKLEEDDIESITEELGEGALASDIITINSYIGKSNEWGIDLNYSNIKKHLSAINDLTGADIKEIETCSSISQVAEHLKTLEEPSEGLAALQAHITTLGGHATACAIRILKECLPVFFYTSHFARMSGEVSINQLKADKVQDRVSEGDQIFLDFIEYAGTSVDELENQTNYEQLEATCEIASNDISDEMFSFWSQNTALSVQIKINQGLPDDPAPFNQGTVVKARIYNDHHRISLPLSERSAGFIWFFSFLAQFRLLEKTAGNAILLVDEPGLTLHGKAQADLLRYITERLLPNHQVIYTTHSPFMVPAGQLADVRVVQDIVREDLPPSQRVVGTKVSDQVLEVDQDTLFPLHAHLGFDAIQSLFIGKNTLLVEGPSDILYIEAVSNRLKALGREHLDDEWVICPSGGLDKISGFASLFSGNGLNIAVLTDFAKGDKNKISRLKESQILAANQVLTTTDFTEKEESDIEDFFAPDLWCTIINGAMELKGKNKFTPAKLASVKKTCRIVKQTEQLNNSLPPDSIQFNHFIGANYLLRNPQLLEGDSAAINNTLDCFEKAFKALNGFVRK